MAGGETTLITTGGGDDQPERQYRVRRDGGLEPLLLYTAAKGRARKALAIRAVEAASDEQLRDLGPMINVALASDRDPERRFELRRLAKALANEQARRNKYRREGETI